MHFNNFSDYFNLYNESDSDKEKLSRDMRNQLLAEKDWTQISDSPLNAEQKAAWATYRQELRDVTAQPDFPDSIQWPTPP